MGIVVGKDVEEKWGEDLQMSMVNRDDVLIQDNYGPIVICKHCGRRADGLE